MRCVIKVLTCRQEKNRREKKRLNGLFYNLTVVLPDTNDQHYLKKAAFLLVSYNSTGLAIPPSGVPEWTDGTAENRTAYGSGVPPVAPPLYLSNISA